MANSDPFFPVEPQPDFPGLPAPSRPCLECGKPVPAPKREGRPSGLCGEACRRARKGAQVRAWHAGDAPRDQVSGAHLCRGCGSPFMTDRAGAGRVPRYCGKACRLEYRRNLSTEYRARRRRVPSTTDTKG